MESRKSISEGDLLWLPSAERIDAAQLTKFTRWLKINRNIEFSSYGELWHWSVTEKDRFWRAVWDYFEVCSDSPISQVLAGETMFNSRWFEGSYTNYAEHLLRYETIADHNDIAIFHSSEIRTVQSITWPQLGHAVRAVATGLRELGIRRGDCVVSYMPNVWETAVAMMACTAIGAMWSSVAPEFGANTVIQRLGQIKPKLLFVADGYPFNGKIFDRRDELNAIIAGLPTLKSVIWLPYIGLDQNLLTALKVTSFEDLLRHSSLSREEFAFERVPPEHPLWVLFSSGTTGPPKAIVHGHAGMLAEHLKLTAFHLDLGPSKRMFFYTTAGWMVWNTVIAVLLAGAAAILYDGSPVHNGPGTLWKIAAETGATLFGASPTLVSNMKAAGLVPKESFDLSRLDTTILGGAPATPDNFLWFYDAVGADLWVSTQSGGTDLCSALVVGAVTEPVYAGEMQVRPLGIDTHVWNDAGEDIVDEMGELVVTSAFPSAPLCFWGDQDGHRYYDTYFSTFRDVWRHGDLAKITARGGAFIYGRSDSTLNRYGIRIGTAEIYRIMEGVPEISDSLIVCCDTPGGGFYMPMFVKINAGYQLSETLKAKISALLRSEATPRHVPDEIHPSPGIPYTLSGKKIEVPIRKLIMGAPVESVVARDAMADPNLLDWYVAFGQRSEVIARLASTKPIHHEREG